jgi:hypothetical protein
MTQEPQDSKESPPLEDVKTQWTNLVRKIFKGIQPIAYNFVIFAAYILADLGIIVLVGVAFSDIINKYPFFGYFYDGIKIGSVFVITLHCLGDYLVQITKNTRTYFSEIFRKSTRKEEETE